MFSLRSRNVRCKEILLRGWSKLDMRDMVSHYVLETVPDCCTNRVL